MFIRDKNFNEGLVAEFHLKNNNKGPLDFVEGRYGR